MSTSNNAKVAKVVLLGESTVGKTCTVLRQVDDQLFKLQIWDTAGQEKYRAITHVYYRGANGAILFYDITARNTFDEKLTEWVDEVRAKASQDVSIVVVGNKVDLEDERQVSTEEGREFAEKVGVPFFEISAKEGTCVEEVFAKLCRLMADKNNFGSSNSQPGNKNVEILTEKPKKKSWCII